MHTQKIMTTSFLLWLFWIVRGCGINSESYFILIANKIFHVTVLLLIYFCDNRLAHPVRGASLVRDEFGYRPRAARLVAASRETVRLLQQ